MTYRTSPGKAVETGLCPLTDRRPPETRLHVPIDFIALGMPAADGCGDEERRGGRIPPPFAAKSQRDNGPFSSSSADRAPPITGSTPLVRSTACTKHCNEKSCWLLGPPATLTGTGPAKGLGAIESSTSRSNRCTKNVDWSFIYSCRQCEAEVENTVLAELKGFKRLPAACHMTSRCSDRHRARCDKHCDLGSPIG